ncbi:MAG TPA: methyltransferase domain-containing protein [Caulobacteraceae bacterium]|jgi:SAM-dependent methyltransferase
MERLIYDRMRTLEGAHWWFVARRTILSRLIGDLPLPPRARLLEAGCGVGGNIDMLRAFGQVEAMEPDGPSRDYVRQRLDLQPADGRLPDGLPYEARSFDGVFALDVVEHVEDDRAALAALGELVAPGGFLFVTVPAYAWMWSRHDELHHHKRRYTKGQIQALIGATGLSLVRASYFNTLLFPVAAAVRVLKRVMGSESEDDRMPSPAVNGLLRGLFSLEGHWLAWARLPFGLSIVAIARREA